MSPVAARTTATVLLALLTVASFVGVVGGLALVSDDMSDRTDSWDGFGAFLGGVLAGICGIALVLALLALLFLRSRPRLGCAFALAAAAWVGGITTLIGVFAPAALLVLPLAVLLAVTAFLACRVPTAVPPRGEPVGWGTY